MKRMVLLAAAMACLLLSGCTVAAFFLSDCGGADADLVVINNSTQEVWSIVLECGSVTQVTQNARERALIGQGESCGLTLEDGEGAVTVILLGVGDRELVRQTVDFRGERLYLTLGQNGSLSVTEEWPDV